jgi:RHS repeat-associated protein
VERGFAGRPTEGLSALINVRARHYDPETGRFLQPDPLGVAADQRYAYAASNPFALWDPHGLQPSSLTLDRSAPLESRETMSFVIAESLGIGLSRRDLGQIDARVAAFGAQLEGPTELFASVLKVFDAFSVPAGVTLTGFGIAAAGIAAVATAPLSAPAIALGIVGFGGFGTAITLVGLDLGATQINETFGTSLLTSGLLPPIRSGRFPGMEE